MMIRTWLRRLLSRSDDRTPAEAPRPTRGSTRKFVPALERLEERAVPAVRVLGGFDGINFNQSNGFVPPDTDVAVGPRHVVEVVNSAIGIYTKEGRRVSLRSLNNFFGTGAPALFDPVVTYNELAGRFVVAALQVDFTAESSFLWVAVSNTSNPVAGFSEVHRIDVEQPFGTTSLWGDYPKIGFNADAVFVTLNMFTFATPTFVRPLIVTLESSSLLDRNPATLTSFQVNRPVGSDFTLAAAKMHGSRPGGPMYFVSSAPTFSANTIQVLRMNNVLSPAPVFVPTILNVGPYTQPPAANQPSGVITTGDTRMLSVAWRNNRLVAAHTVGLGAGILSTVRWYEINTGGAVPTLIQQGNVSPGIDIFTSYPAIEIAPNGNIGMTFMQSSATEFVSMYVTGRTPRDRAGTMQRPILVRAGQNTYSDFTGSPFRAGDYSGIAVDPTNGTFWAATEYARANATNNWGTFITNFTIPQADIRIFYPLRYTYDRVRKEYVGNLTLFNGGTGTARAPLTLVFPQLPPGVTLTNATGTTIGGAPTIRVHSPLGPKEVLRVQIRLKNPHFVHLSTFFVGFPILVL